MYVVKKQLTNLVHEWTASLIDSVDIIVRIIECYVMTMVTSFVFKIQESRNNVRTIYIIL